MDINKMKSLSYDELRALYKNFLHSQNIAKNTINTPHPASLSTAPNRSYYSTIGSFFAMVVFYDAVQNYRRLSDCYIETKQKLLVGINCFFNAYEYRVVDQ